MLTVIRTDQAKADLREILSYLEERSPPAADDLLEVIEQRCALLGLFPKIGRTRDELMPGLRSIAIEKYLLFYRITAETVEVVRILLGSRDIEAIFHGDDPE